MNRALLNRPLRIAPARPARPEATLVTVSSNQRLQARLKVGPVDDPAEREADRVAEALLGATAMLQPAAGTVQRKCAACATEEEQTLRLKSAGEPAGRAAAAVPGLGRGTPLPKAERAYFEPRLGRDLSAVRLHHDQPAAVALGARAFTLGRDIAFAPGEWRPGSLEGRRLLAHELVHVVQQRQLGTPVVQRQKNPIDERAQALIDLAQNDKRSLEARALELIWRMLGAYFPARKDLIAGVSFNETEPGLSVTFRGKTASRQGLLKVGRNFVEGTTRRHIARRLAQLAHELTHVEQQRAGMAGANRSDEREFLAFAEEAAFVELPGTGRIPHAMRVRLIDGALGYYHCLDAELQKKYAGRQRSLLTLRAEHDGKVGNPTTTPPTACRRGG